MTPELKKSLDQLSASLIDLHRDLLHHQTRVVENEDHKKYGPYDLLRMSLNDPRFAWMRRLSKLISRIDAHTAGDKDAGPLTVAEVLSEVNGMLDGTYADFLPNYILATSGEPEVSRHEAVVRQAVANLTSLEKGQ